MKKIRLLSIIAVLSVCASGVALIACGSKNSHTLTLVPEKAATCTEDGLKSYYTCSHCDLLFSDAEGKTETALADLKITMLGHDWDVPEYEWNSDKTQCTATRTCSRDGSHKETETQNAAEDVTKEPSCDAGSKTMTVSSWTNSAFASQSEIVVIPALYDHDWGDPEYKWNSDKTQCTATRTCSHDGSHKETETKTATENVTKQAECEDVGSKTMTVAWTNSAFAAQSETVVIPALGHAWGTPEYEWSTDKTQCTATRICSHDGSHKETETKTATENVTKQADCEAGSKTMSVSSWTNSAFASQSETVVIPALGHDWGTPEYKWNSDKTQCTATRTCSRDGSHIETETKTATENVTKQAECEEVGSKTMTVAWTNSAFAAQTETVVLPAIGHAWGTPEYEWNANKTQCTATRTCSHDGSHKETETKTATENVTKQASCAEEGSKTMTVSSWTNSAFASQSETVAIPAIDHDFDYRNDVKSDGSVQHWHECNVCGQATERETNITSCDVCDSRIATAGLSYELSGTYAKVTGYTGSAPTVVIASFYDGKPVTTIGYHAFFTKNAVVRLYIPEGVMTVEEGGLQYVSNAEYISFPSTLTTFESDFLGSTNKLVGTVINGATYFGNEKNPYLILKAVENSSAYTELIIPEGTQIIYRQLSFDNKNLTKLSLPSTLRYIGQNAFYGWDKLTSATYSGTSDQWDKIEKGSNWNSYCKVDGVDINNAGALTYKPHTLTLVPYKGETCTVNGNKSYYACADCGKWLDLGHVEIFDHNSVVIPAGHVIEYASDGTGHWETCVRCDYVSNVKTNHDFDYRNDVKSGGSVQHWHVCFVCGYATEKETNKTSCDVCDSHIATVGLSYALSDDGTYAKVTGYTGSASTVIIASFYDGKPVTTIGYHAFWTNNTVVNLYIPEGVTTVEEGGLRYVNNAEYISFPSTLTTFEDEFLNDTNKLVGTQKDGATYLGNAKNPYLILKAFDNSPTNTSLIIPEGTQIIYAKVCNVNTNVKTLSLPSTIRDVGKQAFFGTNLTSVTYNGTQTQWDKVAKRENWGSLNVTFSG